MSALVLLYVIGFGALVAGAAAAIEWSVQGRLPTRQLWTVAIVVAVVVPSAMLARRARVAPRPAAASTSQAALVEVIQFGRSASASMGSREQGTTLHALRTRFYMELDRIDHVRPRTLAEMWVGASLILLAWIVSGLAHWQRERSEWEETELDGVLVHLSQETGPAVLGIVTQRIVFPAWARGLAPEYRQLMLAHEREHIAARDPQRLALALTALVVMPWNPALWWCGARLRRAIEVDCDARVLRRHPWPREYGYLLLHVAARGTNAGPLAVPLVNLLRLPSELELRLRAMTRPRTIGGRTALAGVGLAGVAVLAAFTVPVPRMARLDVRLLGAAARSSIVRPAPRPRAWVEVRDTVVELDSVTVDRANDITQGMLPPDVRRRIIRDTLPSARADDSLRFLARALVERTRQIDSMRARMDSMSAALQSNRLRARRGGARVDSVLPRNVMMRAIAEVSNRARADSMNVALKMYLEASGKQINAALQRYYPNLASDATTNTVIWFLADSRGNVVRSVRREGKIVLSPVTAAGVFGDVDPSEIGMSSIREWTVGDRHLSVAWIELKH